MPIPNTARALFVVVVGAAFVTGNSVAPTAATPALHLLPLGSELALGVLIGTIPLVLLGAASVAGDTVGLQSGLTLGGALSPAMRELGAGWGEWFGWLALATFIVLRGDLMVLEALAESFRAFPPGQPWSSGGMVDLLARLPLEIISVGLRIGAPIVVALFVANLGLGLLNRAIPQLNVMMAAFPVTIATALAMGIIGTALFAGVVRDMTFGMPTQWAEMFEAIRAGAR